MLLLGSTPSFINASDSVRDDETASESRSRVYGLTGTVPSPSGRPLAALVRSNEPTIGASRPISDKMRNGPCRFVGKRYGPWPGGAGQNFGSGLWAWTSSAASSSVSTDGGEPASGLFAVSFMQATAITPTRAAAIA